MDFNNQTWGHKLVLWAQTMEIDKSETQKISEIINNNILPYQITK